MQLYIILWYINVFIIIYYSINGRRSVLKFVKPTYCNNQVQNIRNLHIAGDYGELVLKSLGTFANLYT